MDGCLFLGLSENILFYNRQWSRFLLGAEEQQQMTVNSTVLTVSLVFFVIANYFYQAGLIFYDSTLATISTPGNKGRIGGIGIGVGYVGALVGILSALYITETLGFAYPAVFQLTAALFLIFALPCFIFVKETPGDNFWPSLMILLS